MTQTAASPYPAARGEQRKGEQRKPVIKATDMSEDMQQDAIETAAAVSMTAPPAPRLPASAPMGDRRVNSTRAPARPLRPTGRAPPPERTPSVLPVCHAEPCLQGLGKFWLGEDVVGYIKTCAIGSDRPCASFVYMQGLDKFSLEKDVAGYIKNAFDSRYSPTWHCIVGRNFGGRALRRPRHGTPPLASPEPPPTCHLPQGRT